MDKQVGAAAQLEARFRHLGENFPVTVGRLMVAEVGDGHAPDFHPVTERPADVGHLPSKHRCRACLYDTAVGHLEKCHLGRQVIHLHGEVRGLHECTEGFRKPCLLRRPVDVQVHIRTQCRPEERQPLHVVEMEVGDKGAQRQPGAGVLGRCRRRGRPIGIPWRGTGTDRFARKEALQEALSETPAACAEIEQHGR
jgi:hypothetical protein